MRPELEDFDELAPIDQSPRSRAMSWLVLAVAVGGFATLAYYAYHSGSQSMRDGTLTVVNAEEGPIKSAPADPGGEQFPNKDKTIYDAISNDGNKPQVEKLLPEAEQPTMPIESGENNALTPDEPAPSAKAPVNTTAEKKSAEPTTFVNAANKSPEISDEKPSDVKVASKSDNASGAPVTPVEEKTSASQSPSASAPAMVNVKPVTTNSQPTSEEKDAKAKAAVAKPKVAKAATGSAKIQLGAFKSEEEALAQWKKISAKNSDVLAGSPTVVKAELPNGTFYRLRATVADAKAACSALAARKQACFPAGK